MIIINCEQHSEAWFEARCGRVTGTRFKDLVAGENTAAYNNLITNISAEIITGASDPLEHSYTSAIMERGTELEPVARDLYSSLFDVRVEQVGFIIPDEDNKYHEWIGISPDGILPDNGELEIKCPLWRTHLEYIEGNRLPAEYKYQVQGQLYVTGFDYCDFMSYAEGMKPFIIRVYPDPEIFSLFETRLDKLIERVKEKLSTYEKYNHE